MPLGTFDRTAPALFKQGPSALSKLVFFSALALFLMVADVRLQIVRPLRNVVGAVLYPLQVLAVKPVQALRLGGRYLEDLQTAQQGEVLARKTLALQSVRASQVDALTQENARLRSLLRLRETTPTQGRAAEVLYDAADPYSRKIIIDQGMTHNIAPGSPVIDEEGLLGQVTLVQPFTSEVTLVTDRELSVPVQNARTGIRSVAYGDATGSGKGVELRFVQASADLQEGDLLATSGVDGVYPAGLPVARVEAIERRGDSAFARIRCKPLAHVSAARYVLVLTPVGDPATIASASADAGSGEPDSGTTPSGKDGATGGKGDGKKTDAKKSDAARADVKKGTAAKPELRKPAPPPTPGAASRPTAPGRRTGERAP